MLPAHADAWIPVHKARDDTYSSLRTMAAPSLSAFSLAKATSRGRYFMPQSGAGISLSAAHEFQAGADALGHQLRRLRPWDR